MCDLRYTEITKSFNNNELMQDIHQGKHAAVYMAKSGNLSYDNKCRRENRLYFCIKK